MRKFQKILLSIVSIFFLSMGVLAITSCNHKTTSPNNTATEQSTHTFGDWILFIDNATCENRLFYQVCSECNQLNWKKGAYDNHNFTTVTTPPTCVNQGYDTKTCTICGFVETTNYQPKVEHSLAIEYSYNQYAHWFDCDTCDELIGIESHQKGLGECTVCHSTLISNILLVERNQGESNKNC